MKKLNCAQMTSVEKCAEKITHIDVKGFIYCSICGPIRKATGVRCRKLTPKELKQLESGEPLAEY
jgi:hypothetical protein